MKLLEQIIHEWNNCKEKIKQATNSELKQLREQLWETEKLSRAKNKELAEIKQELGLESHQSISKNEQWDPLEEKIHELLLQSIDLSGKIETMFPRKIEIEKLEARILKFSNLQSLKDSLDSRKEENEHYLERIERAEEKWVISEKKLEKLRDLAGEGKVNKIKELFQRGEI